MYKLQKIQDAIYQIPKEGKMQVPGLIIATEKLLQEQELEKSLEQVKNVAQLPGIVGFSIAMPDIHWGYGFPIGGVAAMDSEEGVISPGGVGYDINCGVRFAIWDEPFSSLSEEKRKKLLHELSRCIPSGIGRGKKENQGLTDQEYSQIAKKGARWSIEKGNGFEKDIAHTESHGCVEGANLDDISQDAKMRGANQLGSIGSGNHFVEIGEIDQIQEDSIAASWNVRKGSTYILIHSGSRGFGHQVCQDFLQLFLNKGFAENLPDKQLVCAPIRSEEGKRYLAAMATAANYAFNNRQQILHAVRTAFHGVLGVPHEEIEQLYDVCHNIAKFEEYVIEGRKRTLCVHRKGATRAFGPANPELVSFFQETGQPVLVPGDMGRASYLLAGLGNALTWSSCCHGAGRVRSRHQSSKAWKGKNLEEYMQKIGVMVKGASYKTVAEEMPDAYKDVSEVVAAVEQSSIAKIVARLKPGLVIKG